jgi:hypothetical protein
MVGVGPAPPQPQDAFTCPEHILLLQGEHAQWQHGCEKFRDIFDPLTKNVWQFHQTLRFTYFLSESKQQQKRPSKNDRNSPSH